MAYVGPGGAVVIPNNLGGLPADDWRLRLQKISYVFDDWLQSSVATDMDDPEIIAAVRAGDREVFGVLVERYQRTLYYFVVGKVVDDTEAKDIVQKTFVAAFQNLAEFRLGESFFAWLKGIALNHCRNEWRRYQSQARLAGRLLEEKRAELELASFDARADEGDGRQTALRQCLQQLSPHEQTVVEMRFVQELPLAAIGEQLGRGAEAARLFLYRIRQRLADCVKKRLSFETS